MTREYAGGKGVRWLVAASALALAAGVGYAILDRSGNSAAPHFPVASPSVTAPATIPTPPPAPAARLAPLKTGPADLALVQRLTAANTRFGFQLFARLAANDEGRNIFYSPHGVASALAMTYNGASGETGAAMARTMGVGGMSLADLDRAHAQLATRLRKPGEGISVNVANSLWAGKDLAFEPNFLRRNRDYFGARAATVDYTQPEAAADRINGWVRDQTAGNIDNLVKAENLTDLTALLLVNAVYFQGVWRHRFDVAATKNAPFRLGDGGKVTVPFMHRAERETYGYLDGDGFQAVRLPYGTDPFGPGRFAMYIFLPDRRDGLTSWLKGLTPEAWAGWLEAMEQRDGTVGLPKFRIEYEAEMSEPLSALGMGIAFDPERASFRRMIDDQVYIKRVDHKALLGVDEKGTVAAAATAVQMELLSGRVHHDPFTMVVDHPFFCAIRDDETGEVLFMGAVYRPAPAE